MRENGGEQFNVLTWDADNGNTQLFEMKMTYTAAEFVLLIE